MQGPIATVLQSATVVKEVKGKWKRLILDEEQWSNCFPRAVKALLVSSARKYSENKWNQINGQAAKVMVKVENQT